MNEQGDWYCRNCGYLSASRVTHDETCDSCHTPVEWHNTYEARDLEIVTRQRDRLLEAAKIVVAEYERASKEKYDELCWEKFRGVDPLQDAIEDVEKGEVK